MNCAEGGGSERGSSKKGRLRGSGFNMGNEGRDQQVELGKEDQQRELVRGVH